ncbi:MAG: ferritin-like protein [Reichenbachiella sp.]|uniref:ferritin-like domain-containing protein n=1 Tax=Reichenbachiella sp. TaxID=2184521 RepID=UPI003267FCA0
MSLTYSQKSNPKRHQLVPDDASLKRSDNGNIELAEKREPITIEHLRERIQQAIELEHSTIPPYLCALYSIKDGTNQVAAEIIRSVVIEEMLHMVMVANLLNAVGGKPIIGEKIKGKFTPDYPTELPGDVMPGFIVGLNDFSPATIREFEKIEHPEGGKQFYENDDNSQGSFGGIGEFYAALIEDLEVLEKQAKSKGKTIFTGTVAQVTGEHYYGAGGKIINVRNLKDAKELINEIVGQGEGTLGTIFSEPYDEDNDYQWFGPGVDEYAHYFRFKEIRYERFYAPTDSAHRDSPNKGLPTGEKFHVDWEAVHKFKPNPKLDNYEVGSDLYKKTLEFNETYMALLNNINEACNGNPEVLKTGIPLMYDLKYKATELMNIPAGDNEYMAGPSFEFTNCPEQS